MIELVGIHKHYVMGDQEVRALDGVDLFIDRNEYVALIGPSGCGKSTFLRTLNRMHELVSIAKLSGAVYLDGQDIYAPEVRITDARRQIGMVFQNYALWPHMTIAENVSAGLKLAKLKVSNRDDLVEDCLTRAGLWKEVKDRLDAKGGSLSGGQQQRLCIARALAVNPEVLLMDEPCSALDPGSTLRIEETIGELSKSMTIIIVTHNMQQAARVSDNCAFFLADGGPGRLIESGLTSRMFTTPTDKRTEDYVQGRFG